MTVDFTAFGGVQDTRCAPGAQATGVAALQRFLVGRAVTKAGIPVDLMKKHHKAAVVRELDEAGVV